MIYRFDASLLFFNADYFASRVRQVIHDAGSRPSVFVLKPSRCLYSTPRTVLGLIVIVLILFVGPLLIFVFKLHEKKVEGIYSYGSLADGVGRQFEEKWLRNYEEFRSGALEAPDFSATTDLYQVVANVHDMKLFPLSGVRW